MRRVTRRHALGVLATTLAAGGPVGSAGADATGPTRRGPGSRERGSVPPRSVERLGVAWQRRYGDGGYDRLEAAATADEGAVLAGRSDDPSGGRWWAWLHRTGPDGETRWHRTFADDWLEAALAVAPVADGFVVAGRRQTGPRSSFDAWVSRTDAEGRVEWRWTGEADG